jgi:hypothetical protein
VILSRCLSIRGKAEDVWRLCNGSSYSVTHGLPVIVGVNEKAKLYITQK